MQIRIKLKLLNLSKHFKLAEYLTNLHVNIRVEKTRETKFINIMIHNAQRGIKMID